MGKRLALEAYSHGLRLIQTGVSSDEDKYPFSDWKTGVLSAVLSATWYA